MSRLDDEPDWVGGTLARRRRLARGLLVLLMVALPAFLIPGMAWETRLGWGALGLAIALGIVAIPGRGVFSAPPPVYELVYLALIPVEIVAIIGVNAWAAGREAPGLLGGARDLLGFRFGPIWLSSLPRTLSDTHAACLMLSLLLILIGIVWLLTARFPRAGERDWALSFRAGRAVELSHAKSQKRFGTGALRNLAIAVVALYFPLRESYVTEAMVLPGVITVELGIFLLIALKCGGAIACALIGVAVIRIGLSESEPIAQAITGRASDA